jgi:hypothetical protein
MGLFSAFRALKRELTGEVIQQIDTPICDNMATMPVRLKRDRNSNERYVVVAMIGSGSRFYSSFDRYEFFEFADAINTIRDSLMRSQSTNS